MHFISTEAFWSPLPQLELILSLEKRKESQPPPTPPKQLINRVSVVCVCTENPSQIASVSVTIKITDVNDNPPSLTQYLDAYVCENAKAGQVQTSEPDCTIDQQALCSIGHVC